MHIHMLHLSLSPTQVAESQKSLQTSLIPGPKKRLSLSHLFFLTKPEGSIEFGIKPSSLRSRITSLIHRKQTHEKTQQTAEMIFSILRPGDTKATENPLRNSQTTPTADPFATELLNNERIKALYQEASETRKDELYTNYRALQKELLALQVPFLNLKRSHLDEGTPDELPVQLAQSVRLPTQEAALDGLKMRLENKKYQENPVADALLKRIILERCAIFQKEHPVICFPTITLSAFSPHIAELSQEAIASAMAAAAFLPEKEEELQALQKDLSAVKENPIAKSLLCRIDEEIQKQNKSTDTPPPLNDSIPEEKKET